MSAITLSGNKPKRKLVAEIIASLLLIFFVHTLISSYVQLQSLKNLLGFYTSNRDAIAWIMLVSEFIIVTLLYFPQTRKIGFIASILSSLLAGYIILKYPHFPHDFGGIINYLSSSKQILLYSLLLVLSITGILLIKKENNKTESESQSIVYT
ncbi:hypothetical protein FAM09_11460 [Niastella caeni]|uniref:DoxX family protein n=1 Tax=Niastella caeni TaxID=2569763 RepID=A0A4S8HYQ4_9BACT|nr:hypothetical protein [Niastella caeni]THU40471.1 hypothetical protein FAM09_11460 [Niastella caeni]